MSFKKIKDYSSRNSHNGRKRKVSFSDMLRVAPGSLMTILVYMSKHPRGQFIPLKQTVLHIVVWSLYLPLGSIGPYFEFVKIFLGEEVCSQAQGSRSLKLQASRQPVETSVSKYCFTCFPLVAQKALWHSSNLSDLEDPVLWCFIFVKTLPIRILARSYNGFYFQGSRYYDQESWFQLSRWVLTQFIPQV